MTIASVERNLLWQVVPVDIDLHRSKANHFTCGAGHYIHKCGCHSRDLSFCSPVPACVTPPQRL